MLQHPVIRAQPGAPLGQDETRRRPMGRIGGSALPLESPAIAAMRGVLGHGAQLLSAETELIVDCDGCTDGDVALESSTAWRTVISSDRLSEVEGAFALAWREGSSLFLARDGVGERTLFYSQVGRQLIFASSIRALLATRLIPRTLNLAAVPTYLTYAYLPGTETLIKNVFEVLSGECIEFRDGELRRTHFWSLPAESTIEPFDEDVMRDRLRAALERAVRRRLPAGDPVGVFLSGGLDSSLVVALAKRLHDQPVKTYSISFGDGYANELPFSAMVAEHCQTDHRVVELSPAAVLHHLDESIAPLSDPIGDPLTVPNALLFREAARDVGVILNGEGGDPCFGGPKNLPMLLAELYGGIADTASDPRLQSYLRAHLKCFDELGEMLTPIARDALRDAPLEARLAPYFDDARWSTFVNKLQAINVLFKGPHHILPKVDSISALFGVLPRAPLFDRAVVELSMAIPPQMKLRGSVEKYLLKEAVKDLLPAPIIDRPKSGMLVPVEAWFQGPLLPQARSRLLDGLSKFDLINRDYMERLLDGKIGGVRPRRGVKIWLLITLESWLRGMLS